MRIETRLADSGTPNIKEVEVRAIQGSRGATLQMTNPMPTIYPTCRMLTKEGQPCKGKPLDEGPFCFSHLQTAG